MPNPEDIVDRGFLEARGKLLEVAAFLDRAERYGRADDYRVVALKKALATLSDSASASQRADAFLRAMSDPTEQPLDRATTGPAAGAWQQSTE
ncbi:hypothetical protein [Cerasicoccus arenae]|uniref:Uncharacterized protein n=1 Tax=Cerasicoccus arenae TaxID=424488 RepID=A0A8J3DFR0_9BACT|nr:hypothetical protein [Cerasicoccus arenae]MBK1859875.1 hypothetical protein [Cerasicoccus arenae]GHC01394.1 hypothetical protein GCM10007047_17320 [Cerasicoccus arenae]